MFDKTHENDETYDRYERKDVRNDLKEYYRQFKPGFWAYVCPCCRAIFAHSWGGMPNAFLGHISGIRIGKGCLFKPKDTKGTVNLDGF